MTAAHDRIEDQPAQAVQGREDHQAGREDRRRKTRDQPGFQMSTVMTSGMPRMIDISANTMAMKPKKRSGRS